MESKLERPLGINLDLKVIVIKGASHSPGLQKWSLTFR